MKIYRKLSGYMNGWTLASFIIVLLILVPNLTIMVNFFTESTENWDHIQQYILPTLLKNTTIIIFFTGILTIGIGTSLAWFVSAFDFPGKRFFKWGLILPLAIPPYIAAYTYNGILNYTGVIQTTLRNSFNVKVEQIYFDIMTMPGAVFIFTLFLYPYVYTITRAFLANQSSSLIENARLLGRNAFEIFFRIVLPISRTAIVGGVSLVILEVLNDYGVVKYFGIPTFTTAIFQTWFNMNDLNAAIKLSATLMFIVFFILLTEKVLRGRKKFSFTTTRAQPLKPIQLRGWKALTMCGFCLLIFSLGFLIPFIQLVDWTVLTYKEIVSSAFLTLVFHSLLVAFSGASIIVVFALIIANFTRMHRSWIAKSASRITVLGYSIPGAVIAVGISTVFIDLDQFLFTFYKLIGMETSLLLSTSLILLISAYVVRFLAVGYNSIEVGFDKIGKTYTEAARTLGAGMTKTFFKVDVCLVNGAIFSGFILAFVDIIKELPLTLILRPFNFDTLSTKAFQYASNEQIHAASPSSVAIIIISTMAIYLFHQVLEKEPN